MVAPSKANTPVAGTETRQQPTGYNTGTVTRPKNRIALYWKSRVWLAHCSTLTAKQPLMQPRVKLHNVNDSPFMTQGHPHWCALTASTAVTTRTNVPARTLGLRVVLGHVVQQQRPAEGAVPTLEVHAGVLPQEALVRRRKRGRVRRLIPQVARSRKWSRDQRTHDGTRRQTRTIATPVSSTRS